MDYNSWRKLPHVEEFMDGLNESDHPMVMLAKVMQFCFTEGQKSEDKKSFGWISVEDRLPEENTLVLVWLQEDGNADMDMLRREGKSDGGGLQFASYYIHNISHWMPLPAPPDTGREG